MKIKSIVLGIFIAFLFSFNLTAEEKPVSIGLTTDFAYYPKSDFVNGDTHFAPITGIYSGLEGRVAGNLDYKIPVPLGEHWLLKDSNIVLSAKLELTPVSIKPGASVSFTPLPFLVFSTGFNAGTGWNLLGLQGMAYLSTNDKKELVYKDYSPFGTYYLNWYAQGTFQFDTGAIFSGDWTHVQIMYTYQVSYEALTAAKKGEIWMWQCSGNRVNGWSEYQSIILAYQMPLVLSRIGVLTEIYGHYKDSDFEPDSKVNPYRNYNGSFRGISISPLMQFTLGPKDTLTALAGFSSRRSFKEAHTESIKEPFLTYSGREWYFNRIAFSWSHNF